MLMTLVAAAEYRSVTSMRSAIGSYLQDSVLDSVYVQTFAECLQHCVRRCPYCGSINAELGSGSDTAAALHSVSGGWWQCELNYDDGSNVTMLTTRQGWQFHEVDVTRCY